MNDSYSPSRLVRSRVGHALLIAALLAGLWLLPPLPARAASFTVTRFDDPTPDGCAPTDCSLREAVIEANNNLDPSDTITLSAGTYTLAITSTATLTSTLEQNPLYGDLDIITGTVTIVGTGAVTIRGLPGPFGNRPWKDRLIEVAAGATATLTDLTLTSGRDELPASGGGEGGGAILNKGTLTIQRLTISNNTSDSAGGGIASLSGATLTVIDSTISNNTAATSGGGIFSDGAATISGSTISANTANNAGGGIRSRGLTLTNSTVSGNTAGADLSGGTGGGIAVAAGGTATIRSSTIVANTGFTGNNLARQGGTVNIGNSVVALGPAGGTGDCSGTITSAGYNLVQDTNGCTFNSSTGDIIGQDPQLGPLADNGGLTLTHLPAETSPLIDAGNPATGGAGACPATDQRGIARPQDDGCDIGAVEFNTPPRLLTLTTVTPDPRNTAVESLTVTFDEAVTGFDAADITLTRDGAPVTLDGVNVTSTDNITFTISGLEPLTTPDGVYELTVVGAGITDAGGSPVPGDTSESWTMDTEIPTASLTAGDVTLGAATYQFTVTYDDNLALDVGTIGTGDVTVSGPNGFSQQATLVGVPASNGSQRIATYQISAPGGSWNMADNGDYTVTLNANQVSDTAGNGAAAGPLGGFTVDLVEEIPRAYLPLIVGPTE
ncbi:MAG TPA: right-handed parallel beta-helix repeat-containing protein [Roseiflexaceae bacterium]|nr:right-handed parallel beta-helix repeat-containing protein [Roseiflexaceae bacterium]